MIKATITGRIGKDPQFFSGDRPRVAFSLASDHYESGTKSTMWVDCVMFGRRAELLNNYATKGRQIVVCGTLSLREFDKRDGTRGAGLKLVLDDYDLVGGVPDKQEPEGEYNPFEDQ